MMDEETALPVVPVVPVIPDKPAAPTHYKVICISIYTQDLDELNEKVAELKRRGWSKANRSQLIRIALSRLNIDEIDLPRQ